MNTLLLGSPSAKWIKSLSGRQTFQVRQLNVDGPLNLAEAQKQASLVILDQSVFRTLSEDQKAEIHRSRLMLVTDKSETNDSLDALRRACMAVFVTQKGSGDKLSTAEEHNFITLVERLLDHLTLSGRLDSYIRDSFSDIVDSSLLIRQKQEIEDLNKKLEELSRIDFLTNLLNRRAVLDAFNKEKNRALRTRLRIAHADANHNVVMPDGTRVPDDFLEHIGNFACILIDIDHFKKVNDTYGHLAGDRVLQEFGRLLRNKDLFRENDTIGRYGGEEFIILLPDTNSEHAFKPAERLRQAIKQIAFFDDRGREFHVSISLGIAEFLPEEVSCDEMIQRADLALYYAKEHGRDQTCVFSHEISAAR